MAANRTVHVWSIEKEEQYATIARDLISLAGLQDYIDVITVSALMIPGREGLFMDG